MVLAHDVGVVDDTHRGQATVRHGPPDCWVSPRRLLFYCGNEAASEFAIGHTPNV